MGNRQNLPHSQLTETKPKQQNQPPSEKVISHFYRKKFARPKSLEKENGELKKMYADAMLGIKVLKEALEKKL